MKVPSFSGCVFLLVAASVSADMTWADRARIRAEIQAAAASEEVELQTAAADELAAIAKFIEAGDDTKREEQKKEKKKEEKDKKSSKDTKSSCTKREKQKAEKAKSSSASSTKKSKKKSCSSTKKSKKKSSSSSSKSSRDSRGCVDKDDEKLHSTRNGGQSEGKYEFELYEKDAQCTDKDDKRYEYGQFDNVKEFSDCADACVKDVKSELLKDFRGFDWDCDEEKCRCLYDKDTLDDDNDKEFDKTDKGKDGKGHVKGSEDKDMWYCAKLTDSPDFAGYVAIGRALRGHA